MIYKGDKITLEGTVLSVDGNEFELSCCPGYLLRAVEIKHQEYGPGIFKVGTRVQRKVNHDQHGVIVFMAKKIVVVKWDNGDYTNYNNFQGLLPEPPQEAAPPNPRENLNGVVLRDYNEGAPMIRQADEWLGIGVAEHFGDR